MKVSVMESKKKLVIIGGGYAGTELAAKLDSLFDITVLERRSKFYMTTAVVRGIVDPKAAEKLFVPYDKALKRGRVVNAEVTGIENNTVTARLKSTGEDKQFPFDYLILATGSSHQKPFYWGNQDTEESMKEHFATMAQKLNNARSVLVVGGGPVGAELAGEIATDYPSVKVTLAQSSNTLIEGPFPEPFKKKVYDKLVKELKVEVILGDRVNLPDAPFDPFEHRVVTTSGGRQLECDILLVAFGSRPNTDLFQGIFALDEKRYVKVNKYFQVEGRENVFAMGDIVNVPEPKQVMTVLMGHIPLLEKNLKKLLAKKPMEEYKQAKQPMMVVSLGRRNGAGFLGFVIGKNFSTMIKSKTMMIDKKWSAMHAVPNKA